MEQDSEFYIGWQATAPPTFKKAVRRFVLGLCLLVPVLAVFLAMAMRSRPVTGS
jgi:hypothetical protein